MTSKDTIKYSTKEECLQAIRTVKALGMDPASWMLAQLEEFETREKEKNAIKNSKTPIWDTLRIHYPYGNMPQEKIDCVENTVRQLLEKGEHGNEPGLLLGKIQCGKTDTFEDIIGLSFDKGIDLAVVLTKGTKALVKQTISRMKHDYQFFMESSDLTQPAIINIKDIMDIKRGVKNALFSKKAKLVIVSKKNAKNLEYLINLFNVKSEFLKKKKVLVVDDEADFASRNYILRRVQGEGDKERKELTIAKISQQIDEFRRIPEYCRYLQVTATPYCLYLQPGGELNLNGNIVEPFKPRFTELVPVHEYYVGGREYFELSENQESMYSELFHPVEQKCIDVLGHEDKRYIKNSIASSNIYGLTYALVAYFMATAIRRIQEREKGQDYKSSAVFHVEINKKNHEWQYKVINRLIDDIKRAIVENDTSDERINNAIEMSYENFSKSNEKAIAEKLIKVLLPKLDEVKAEMCNIFADENFHIQMVNSDEQMDSILNEKTGELSLEAAANIFIGGNILDRGVTIKSMLCFFYGRNPKNFQQDTVLQHARMYGARSKEDMAVMRFYTTENIYRMLKRINELDNQLRDWFIQGRNNSFTKAVFVGYDKSLKPCASQKIKASNALTLKPQKRILPVGFWTGNKNKISGIVAQIDKLIENSPSYGKKDPNGFFEIEKPLVREILNKIMETYVYDSDHHNLDRKSDIVEMQCALEYCTSQTGGKLYALHRTGRDMTRIRENGAFVDAPDDGRTDGAPSKEKAIDWPVIMFIRENGSKQLDSNNKNIGWNNAPFYWPVLLTQKNINPVMFALDPNVTSEDAVTQVKLPDGIDPSDVLKLTFSGDLQKHFGCEGTEYADGDEPFETRALKNTTASRYLEKAPDGTWQLAPDVNLSADKDRGLYSLNGGKFPFVLRPYKYMLLTAGRSDTADVILLELTEPSKWGTLPESRIDEEGNLIDRDSEEILVYGRDVIVDKNLDETEYEDDQLTQWIIEYKVRKVIRFWGNMPADVEDVDEP